MLSGVTTICFTASYAVALVLEFARLVVRGGVRGALSIAFASAGLVAHTAFLYYRALDNPGSPLSSQQDWFLLAAWLLVVVYLYLSVCHPRQAFGLFLLPLVLVLVAVATLLAASEPYPRGPASEVWGAIHGTSILLATVVVLFGFATGLMYFGQASRLKRKRPSIRGLQLPSLEWLGRANSRSIEVASILFGIGVVSGAVLTAMSRGDRIPSNDPVIVATISMFVWLSAASLVGVFYRPARAGRKVAYVTLVSFVFLVAALGVGLGLDTLHGGSRNHEPGAKSSASEGR